MSCAKTITRSRRGPATCRGARGHRADAMRSNDLSSSADGFKARLASPEPRAADSIIRSDWWSAHGIAGLGLSLPNTQLDRRSYCHSCLRHNRAHTGDQCGIAVDAAGFQQIHDFHPELVNIRVAGSKLHQRPAEA
jgi:hypothetical protein